MFYDSDMSDTPEAPALPTFLVFAGESYYPKKGARDFVSAHLTLDEATEVAQDQSTRHDWSQVAELTVTGLDIVMSFGVS